MACNSLMHKETLRHYIRAGSKFLTSGQLRALALSEIDKVRQRVAENTRTPKDVLQNLLNDSCQEVRIAAAANGKTPLDAVMQYLDCASIEEKSLLAQVPSAPQAVLSRLSEDDNPYISLAAFRSLEIAQSAAGKSSETTPFEWMSGAWRYLRGQTFIRRRLGAAC